MDSDAANFRGFADLVGRGGRGDAKGGVVVREVGGGGGWSVFGAGGGAGGEVGAGVEGVGRLAGLFLVTAGIVVLLGLAPVVVAVSVRLSPRGASVISLSSPAGGFVIVVFGVGMSPRAAPTNPLMSALGGMARHGHFCSFKCESFPAMRWRRWVSVISRVRVTGALVHHIVVATFYGRHCSLVSKLEFQVFGSFSRKDSRSWSLDGI
jgi:hypothetical protein